MLGLVLRKEFQGQRLKSTVIEFANNNQTGAIQIPASEFLEITYPSVDLLKAIEAIGPEQGRPVVLIGERGQGKSHLMAALYHSLQDPVTTREWLTLWSSRLGNPRIAELPLRNGMHVITESLHRQRYKFLWDLLFERHPQGEYIRGKWDAMGEKKTDIPSADLLVEMFQKQSVVLILDEFQTWFDGLTNTRQYPWRNWAFNFVQILSEIAKEHPELLVLVVSVRNGNTDAYQQIHRVNPTQIDFKGPQAGKDRRRLLLHRLFENRMQIATPEIETLLAAHLAEYFRLAEIPEAEHEWRRQEFCDAWPFAPHLMQLLEDQVLVATSAQETRDLIRILATLYKQHGSGAPILTAADFRVDTDDNAITSLLDSVGNHHHSNLREKARRNLAAVLDVVKKADAPHLSEIIGALWLRSLAVGNQAGAEASQLQIDITRGRAVDDNAFQFELNSIVENSFNIHREGARLIFREEENPQAKLLAFARNDKLFQNGEDRQYLAKEIRFVLSGDEQNASLHRVVVLPREWPSDPWSKLDPAERPEQWDERLPVVVLPETLEKPDEMLGRWLRDHLQRKRNTVRFLLPKAGTENIYYDRELIILARATSKAAEWSKEPEYKKLHQKYQGELRDALKRRFDRFAVLMVWNYSDPSRCRVQIEQVKEQGAKILPAIEEAIQRDLFIPEEFDALVRAAAENNDSVGKLLRELQEPRPKELDCISWLGETLIKEKIERLCARGRIAINVRGMEQLQARAGEDEDSAWRRMRGRLGSGKHLDETNLLPPQVTPQSLGVPPAAPVPGAASGEAATGSLAVHVAEPKVVEGEPGSGEGAAGPGNPFTPTPPSRRVPHSAPATSALNLLGKTESWGIGPAAKLADVTIRISSLSGAQLQNLLRKLPDGLTYELDLQKEEE